MTEKIHPDILTLVDAAYMADLLYADENEPLTAATFHEIADVNADIAVAFKTSGVGKRTEHGSQTIEVQSAARERLEMPRGVEPVGSNRKWNLVYRSVGTLAVVALILPFLIDIRGVLSNVLPGEERITASAGQCDWSMYNFVSGKVKGNYYSPQVGRELIGADKQFLYFYDFRSDTITCVKLVESMSVAVAGEMRRVRVYTDKQLGVFSCIAVITLCGVALYFLRLFQRQ